MRARRGLPGAMAVWAMVALGCGGTTPPEPAPSILAATSPVDTAQGGQTSWARQLGGAGQEAVLAVAAGADGSTTLLTGIGAPAPYSGSFAAAGLVRLDAAGGVSWSRQLPLAVKASDRPSIAVTGQGNTFLAVTVACAGTTCPDLGQGPLSRAALLKFDPAGRLVWQRLLAGDRVLTGVAADGTGGAAVGLQGAVATVPRIVHYAWDGTLLWDVAAPRVAELAPGPSALAFDPAGNLAVGDGLAFYSLDPSARIRWSAVLSGPRDSGRVAAIGTTATGTVVAVVQVDDGTVSWGGTEATAAGPFGVIYLAVAEASGAPRIGRVVATGDRGVAGAAVDPAGRVSILTRGAACDDVLERWNLAGALLWRRPLQASCTGGVALGLGVTADPVSHHVRVGGEFAGTVDVGAGPLTSRGGTDGFVVDILP